MIPVISSNGIKCIMWNIVSTGYQLDTVESFFRLSHPATENKSVKPTKQRKILRQSTFQRQQIGWTNHHQWLNLREVPVPVPADLSWRNRGHRCDNSHAQIDVVDCGVMTVRIGGFFPDGLALLALRLDHCVTFCSPCDFLLI